MGCKRFHPGQRFHLRAAGRPGESFCWFRPGFVYLRAVKMISWNVNGLRAVLKKNFLEFIDAEKPEILCLQETKCTPEDVEQLWPASYTTYWNSAQKKGYSGTVIYTKIRPLDVSTGIGVTEHDQEGRVLTLSSPAIFWSMSIRRIRSAN